MEEQPLHGRWFDNVNSDPPPPFVVEGEIAVPIKVQRAELAFEIDVAAESGIGHAKIFFNLSQAGRPLLDMVPRPSQLVINDQALPLEQFKLVVPPDADTPLRMLNEQVEAGEHVLQIDYQLGDDTAEFGDGGAQLNLFMTDREPRGFLERHAPASLEFDQMQLDVEVQVSGNGNGHQLFSNGTILADGNNTWRVSFPDYFNCSSCYLHLTNRPVNIREDVFMGAEREVPITCYGDDPAVVMSAVQRAQLTLQELEETFGPYAHNALLIYCTGNGGRGMEYAGATMTSLAALSHEITHSWFARGVMPANGNAGWIDEAIARWRDRGYPRTSTVVTRPPVNLAGFSPYRRDTPFESYALGSILLSELDGLLAPGGLRPVLGRLFREKQRQVITTPFFQNFLEQQTGIDLGPMFSRYVYGKSDVVVEPVDTQFAVIEPLGEEMLLPPGPHAFTSEELRSLL